MKKYIVIFISFFVVRLAFAFAMGFYNNYNLQPDSIYLIEFSDKALRGDFNFDYGRFITSPGFSCLAACIKILFGQYWATALVLFQILLSSLSGVYLYKICMTIFNSERGAAIAATLFCLFPMTFWYVHTFSQETLFQSLFIICIYFLIQSYQKESIKSLFISALLFSFTYITKSHILLFALFIPLIFLLNISSFKKAVLYSILYTAICVASSIPYGMYHLKHNNTYVLSSNGSGMQFYLGNTNAGYISIVDVPEKNSPDYVKMKDITNTAGYFNGNQSRFDSIINLHQDVKQKIFFSDAITWMKDHPKKILELKLYDLAIFLSPGVSFRHYPFREWLMAFILSFPIYILAYLGMYKNIKENFAQHFFMLAIFLAMVLFSTIYYVQNRFRTITIEPFYIIYASYYLNFVYTKYSGLFFTKTNRNTAL